jgi:hypothetical protein
MKKIFCLGLVLSLMMGLGSCNLFPQLQDQISNMGNGLDINLNNEQLQDMFNQGLEGLENLFGPSVIEGAGDALDQEAGYLHVYADKVILTINTDEIRAKMHESNVTVESIKAERENAKIAQMEYILQYQYGVSLKINNSPKTAICYATVTEDTLSNTVSITIPVAEEEMGVTIYELLQGGTIQIESCLQHGTDTTKKVNETYYLNSVPEGKAGNVFTLEDHRKS